MQVLAIDFGASSGRAVLGKFIDGRIELTEIHRFSNDPVMIGDTLYWDVLRLFHEIKQSIIKAKDYGGADSVAIDTWGVDFGIIGKNGKLLENPVHYRDKRTAGLSDGIDKFISKSELYKRTGVQIMDINTAVQLIALKNEQPAEFFNADKLLLMPDLFGYFLTGRISAEQSIASTTQLYNPKSKDWDDKVINALGLNRESFPEIIPPGSVKGTLTDALCKELSTDPIKIISVCGHDTESALVSVCGSEDETAFLSCGTWSLLGTELEKPLMSEQAYLLNISNETGYGGKTAFLKNIIGLWLIQESRRQWIKEGSTYSFAELEALARNAKPLSCFIDPDDCVFTPAGDIPTRIKDYCRKTNQHIPCSVGEITRCIYDSLAMKYRMSVEELECCTNKRFSRLCMVGGGTKDKLLPSLAANALGITVIAGPTEATALGNIAVQLLALGEIKDLSQARKAIEASEERTSYTPQETEKYSSAYERFKTIICKER